MKVPLKAFSFITLLLLLFSCTKESFTNSQAALLIASADTLKFDTVFTSTGSVSQFVKIINENDKGIKIQAVRLAGGSASFFKINVDGVPGPQVNDVDVLSGDSIYIYVSVRIDPTAADLPFIIRDSIEISYNGNKKWVQLEAFGQNAHFFRNKIISTNEIWNNDL
ncbi:MAG: hypothetical protein H0U44_12450, partial [Flavisolibacter sp.]|nr:hypothetical protein [Flavisolibacter sp.]